MINRVLDKINNKYIFLILLVVFVIITITLATFFAELKQEKRVVLNGEEITLKEGLILKNGISYITLEDIEHNYSNYVFYDKISRTLIITTWDRKVKIKKGDEGTLDIDGNTVYSVKLLAEKLGYTCICDEITDRIHIYSYKEIDAKIIKNRTEAIDIKTGKVINILEKEDVVKVLDNAQVYLENEKHVTTKIEKRDGTNIIAKVSKKSLTYNMPAKQIQNENKRKISMVVIDSKIANTTDINKVNSVAVEALELVAANKIEKNGLNGIIDKSNYVVINNGYKLAGFDTNIITDLVHSDKNKEEIANYLLDYVVNNKYEGIIIDFKKFKVSDKDLLEQYIKEIAVLMHSKNKKLIVKMKDTSTYDVEDVKDFVDYIIVETYGARTIASKMSGPNSSIKYVENKLTEFLKTGLAEEKIILEFATYSILWTERGGTVINAEEYSMKAAEKYVKDNNIKTVYNEESGQNLAIYTKGIVTYKMWLEDSVSIKNKVNLIKKYNLAGLAIYKSGEEVKEIYNVIDIEVE